jgi:hypothetical protein
VEKAINEREKVKKEERQWKGKEEKDRNEDEKGTGMKRGN